jgi:hypothetical protein
MDRISEEIDCSDALTNRKDFEDRGITFLKVSNDQFATEKAAWLTEWVEKMKSLDSMAKLF